MRNILLVEPAYNNPYPPLGLMKISSMHKANGDKVQIFKDTSYHSIIENYPHNYYKILDDHYDLIYITSLFTYQAFYVIKTVNYFKVKYPDAKIKIGGIFASLMPDYIETKTGIKPFVGLLNEAEYFPPDYTLFPNWDCSISFTSRGCPRSCKYCAVKKHEPIFFTKDNWLQDIDITKRKIIFWDNNWLASPNFVKDIIRMKTLVNNAKILEIDFNQGLDCRLINEKNIKAISSLPIKPLRLAFDNPSEDGYIQKAIELAHRYGIKDISVYVLYNSDLSNDDPDYFYYRINEINKLGALSYPMKYRPIDSLNPNYISEKWDKKLLRALKLSLMFFYSKGIIRTNRDAFLKIYGTNSIEFTNKLYEIFEKDKKRNTL